jgi:NADP-dependent 3-hydroxy acid dehydrogenase YdfG
MESRPLDKWILVTGANDGGLGEATSVAFLARGFNVIAASFDDEPLSFTKPLKGSTDGFLVRLGLDTTSARSIEAAVEHVQQLTEGKLDILISMWECPTNLHLFQNQIDVGNCDFTRLGVLMMVSQILPDVDTICL